MMLTCISPADGAYLDLATDEMKEWFALGGSTAGAAPADWLALRREGEDRSLAKEIEFVWSAPADVPCTLHLLAPGGREWTRTSRDGHRAVSGLEIGGKYTWYVTCGDEASEAHHFTTSPEAPRLVTVGGISNVRDMGGWSVPGGRIRQSMIYRGGELESHMTVTPEGLRVLTEDLGIATDVDLRRETDLTVSPIPGADMAKLGLQAYRELIEDDSAVARAFFDLLLIEDAYPMYIHCWGGADRTGCLCFLLGAVLGMRDEDLFRDYELTSLAIWGERSVTSDLFAGFLEALRKYGTPEDSAAVCAVKFLRAVGLEDWQTERIREILVEKG